jgi:hypothetical protein
MTGHLLRKHSLALSKTDHITTDSALHLDLPLLLLLRQLQNLLLLLRQVRHLLLMLRHED